MTRTQLLLALALVALVVSTTACDGVAQARRADRLVLTGSSTVAPLALEIAKRFEATHPGTRIDVQTGGSSRGVGDARSGLADIGMTSRALHETENDLRAFTIARDKVSLFVHASNPITELSDDEIVAIYRGTIRNWSAVGGADAPITVVHKAAGRATQEVFLEHFGLRDDEVRADVVVGDNEQGVKTVAGDPNAIAYVSIGAAEYNARHGVPIRLLPARGAGAITRPLNLVTRDAPAGLVAELIDYARSPEVHDLVRELYFVPLGGPRGGDAVPAAPP